MHRRQDSVLLDKHPVIGRHEDARAISVCETRPPTLTLTLTLSRWMVMNMKMFPLSAPPSLLPARRVDFKHSGRSAAACLQNYFKIKKESWFLSIQHTGSRNESCSD